MQIFSIRRWVVVTNNLLLTFKERRVYESHTELIILKEIVSIKSCEDDEDHKNMFVSIVSYRKCKPMKQLSFSMQSRLMRKKIGSELSVISMKYR